MVIGCDQQVGTFECFDPEEVEVLVSILAQSFLDVFGIFFDKFLVCVTDKRTFSAAIIFVVL